MDDGSLWIWGGSILVPTKTRYAGIKDLPTFVSSNTSNMLVLLSDGSLYLIPRNTFINSISEPTNTSLNQWQVFTDATKVSGLSNILAVNQTVYGSYFVLRSNGDVWVWGRNNDYELG
jgi:alpha-tubulin suppressor-like RCC1 family protein